MLALQAPSGRLRVVAVGAHPDDIEIGCGGTLLQLRQRAGTELSGCVLTGSSARHAETAEALAAFFPGAELRLESYPDGFLPEHWGAVKRTLHEFADDGPADLVLCPRDDDAHQDHALVGRLARTVWRDALVLHYEIPKWDGDMGRPSHYVRLSATEAARKVELLHKHFPSQHGHDWWDDETFLGLMRLRGVESRAPFAEAFLAPKVLLQLS
ncbi:MAG TPA: PIG-L deacetylase family protein [Segeticoccus sp.]|jgi:LmbE family N-acetylglucosaminyl deacetylase|nr:PIG-L deacetylase family protein [Segeticoccus sp.]